MESEIFFERDFANSALYMTFRALASYIDGLKVSGRKVVYTVGKQNIREPLKVMQLASRAAEATQYLHGSLDGVIVSLAQDYTGANNAPLLNPKGSFGTRFAPEPSASRYIFTCKSPYFDAFIKKEDEALLTEQEFEGEKIEYQFYVPVLPLILVNGAEGIGSGFAQKILPRNPSTLRQEIEKKLADSSYQFQEITPYFAGFKGTVEKVEGTTWAVHGVFKKAGANSIIIEEVPIGYTLQSYLSVLEGLVEKKVIKGYTDKCENDQFHFILDVTREFSSQTAEEIREALKLTKRVTENFTCIDEKNQVVEFSSMTELMKAYFKIRLSYYSLRKEHLFQELTRQGVFVSQRNRFIQEVISGNIVVAGRSKADVESQIQKANFVPIDGGYDYLLSMPIYSLTEEKARELAAQEKEIVAKMTAVKKMKPADFWLGDFPR